MPISLCPESTVMVGNWVDKIKNSLHKEAFAFRKGFFIDSLLIRFFELLSIISASCYVKKYIIAHNKKNCNFQRHQTHVNEAKDISPTFQKIAEGFVKDIVYGWQSLLKQNLQVI